MPVEPRQYDPTRAHFGKELRSQRFIPELGDYIEEVEYEQPQDVPFLGVADDPDRTQWSVIGEEIVNERNSNKVRHKELRYPYRLDPGSGDPSRPDFPIVGESEIAAEELMEFTDCVITVARLEEKGQGLDADDLGVGGVIKASLNQYGARHNLRKIWRACSGSFLTLTSYDTDPTTGHRIRVTRSVVNFVPSPASPTVPGVSVEYRQIAKALWIKEERTLLDATGQTPVTGSAAFATVTYWTRMNFTFPSYIKPFDPYVDLIRTLNRQQRRTIFDIRIRTRREFSANVWCKKVISYHAAAPAKPAIFEWRYTDWRHDGALFRVNIERTIANETPIYAITLFNDTFYGAYNELVIFPASPKINTDQYMGQIGVETLVDADVQQIENRIFRMVKSYVVME